MQVTAIMTWNQNVLRSSAAMLAIPQVKLDNKRQAVSIATFFRLNSCAPDGPPSVCPDSTAKVAKKQENITMSERMKIQKPKPVTIRFDAGPSCVTLASTPRCCGSS